MSFPRESGIIMHPSSFSGPYGIGEIGPQAMSFVNDLAAMGQHLWQVLPLGPTSYGDSPYQSLSTFAGNTLLISFDLLVRDKLLNPDKLKRFPELPDTHVDYGKVIPARMEILRSVCRTFGRRASARRLKAFRTFCAGQAYWLDDYALFVALKDAHGGQPWTTWEKELTARDPDALRRAERKHQTAVRNEKILQYIFHDQWTRLLNHAHKKGVSVIGDIPIFVAHDSADVWANQDLFFLDNHGQCLMVAGVPPDYFSVTGQLWGNPLYRWNVHRNSDFSWWRLRMRKMFETVDYVRIDHFRGFEKYWEIPAHEKTAVNGRWVEGPGEALFESLIKEFGPLPIIAEDLGLITPAVDALRQKFHFPGMRVLQFAFGTDPKAADYRPESYPQNCVVYTGTHDNDTTAGWFWSKAGKGSTRTQREIEDERRVVLGHVGTDGSEIHWDLMALAMRSRANTAVFPMQDLLGLSSSARMNVPGRKAGNWQWRILQGQLTREAKERLLQLALTTQRTH